MPYRKTPLIVGEIYHVFNRSVAKQPIFTHQRDYQRALDTLEFYTYPQVNLRFSYYQRLDQSAKQKFLKQQKSGVKPIAMLAFCLMPNHAHFLIQEKQDGGISSFMRKFQNSYARYFNVKRNRTGALFQSMFKAVRVENESQLIHVCRYIHLNPYSSSIISTLEELEAYSWSSLPTYLGYSKSTLIDTSIINPLFSSAQELKETLVNHADCQRSLDQIKHLLLDD